MATYDAVWKEALEAFFREFLALLFPDVEAGIDWQEKPRFRDKELQRLDPRGEKGRRSVDKLVEVRLRDGSAAAVFVHVEVQGERQPEFARRMFVYHYRLVDRYDGRVVSLAVLADASPTWRPDTYEYEMWGCGLSFRFVTAKLLDYEEREDELTQSDNAFAPIVSAHLAAMRTRGDHAGRMRRKLAIIRRLYERRWSRARIQKLFLFIDGLMTLPADWDETFLADLETMEKENDMPIVSSIERLGIKKGREQGIEQGELRMARQNIVEVLEVRFGSVPASVRERVSGLPRVNACRELLRAAIQAESIEAFEEMLQASLDTTD